MVMFIGVKRVLGVSWLDHMLSPARVVGSNPSRGSNWQTYIFN